ncbi:MAG: hypothetical protein A2Z14_18310 [Chloroflexi bacterium RBG_16_48_8]|nr:MAG: hypothetical protein A2Z14_18310 [Chloroflexi bacterium RBG_16_48_8]
MDSKEQARTRAPGTTTIAPGVLVTIARLSALSVEGVAGMAARVPSGMNRFLRRGTGEGVEVQVDNGSVSVDLYLVLKQDTYVRDVSRNVQTEVARAIEDMVGMDVKRIDIHIEDIGYD